MINDAYIEVMVARKMNPVLKVAQIVAAVLTVFFALLALMGFVVMLALALICGVTAYFLGIYISVEYEYTYVDKELQIDRILAKSKRKRMATLDLLNMEIMAPVGSHQLDSYRNRSRKTVDYSSGEAKQPEERYMLCMNEGQFILEPSEPLVKMIQNISPRKVFTY